MIGLVILIDVGGHPPAELGVLRLTMVAVVVVEMEGEEISHCNLRCF